MPREKETFRLELEEILKFTGGRRVLTVTDVSNYTGQSRRVCRERIQRQRERGNQRCGARPDVGQIGQAKGETNESNRNHQEGR